MKAMNVDSISPSRSSPSTPRRKTYAEATGDNVDIAMDNISRVLQKPPSVQSHAGVTLPVFFVAERATCT